MSWLWGSGWSEVCVSSHQSCAPDCPRGPQSNFCGGRALCRPHSLDCGHTEDSEIAPPPPPATWNPGHSKSTCGSLHSWFPLADKSTRDGAGILSQTPLSTLLMCLLTVIPTPPGGADRDGGGKPRRSHLSPSCPALFQRPLASWGS